MSQIAGNILKFSCYNFDLNWRLKMDPTTSSDAAAAAAATTAAAGFGALAIGWVIFWIIFGVISLIFFIWWIVLIIDLTKREFPEKNTWLIIMIVGLVVGLVWLVDLLYYFMVVKKYGKGGGTPVAPPTAPPPQK
jgi:hypothetical protein